MTHSQIWSEKCLPIQFVLCFLIFLSLHRECYGGVHFLIQLTGSVG